MMMTTKNSQITLTIDPDDSANWWVESSYAVHLDMCSHSSIIMTLRKGVTYSTSFKQKINTKSSTEAELVAIDDAMGQVLWTRHFLAVQGVPVPTMTIYQDNKSTLREWYNLKWQENQTSRRMILLHNRQEKNGK